MILIYSFFLHLLILNLSKIHNIIFLKYLMRFVSFIFLTTPALTNTEQVITTTLVILKRRITMFNGLAPVVPAVFRTIRHCANNQNHKPAPHKGILSTSLSVLFTYRDINIKININNNINISYMTMIIE